MEDEKYKIGKKLTQFREEAGFTRVELAQKIGTNAQQIKRYEKDLQNMSLSRFMQICEILDVPYIKFLV